MEERKSIFNYIRQWLATFGTVVVIFLVLLVVVGDFAKDQSSLFQFGGAGLALPTLLQLLGLTLVITIAQNVFFTDLLIKNMSLILRNVCFFGVIIVATVSCCVLFKWFPADNVSAWIGFVVSFITCTAISTFITRVKENVENAKMEKALDQFKGK